MNDHHELIKGINLLILHYGIDVAGKSIYRLTTLNPDGSNYYNTDIDKETEVCERDRSACDV